MDTIKVRAVEGRLLPRLKRPGDYVGWERCAPTHKDAEHVVPFGSTYRRCGAVSVPNERYYRAAIRRGDIEVEKPSSSKKKEG